MFLFAIFDPEGKGQSSKPGAEHQDRREFLTGRTALCADNQASTIYSIGPRRSST